MANFSAYLVQKMNLFKKVTILGTKSSLIPAATHLEDKILVSVADIIQKIGDLT